jgi:hypothetical protein
MYRLSICLILANSFMPKHYTGGLVLGGSGQFSQL